MALSLLHLTVILGVICGYAHVAIGAPFNIKADGDVYQIGVGIADVTGPAAQVNMMGYSIITQTVSGIHLRQFSRAFVFADDNTRIVFVSVDAGMISQAIKIEVTRRLIEKYGGLYTDQNVCLSGTHTHSGPAGFFQYVLYDVTSLGFIKDTFDALVDGIIESISLAHDNLQPGRIYFEQGDLVNASINRSPPSYELNPEDERAKYEYNTDKKMFLLKLVDLNDQPIGMVNWFSVHGTSMNNTNGYISSDNKGYASLLFENQYNPPGSFPGKGPFVGAFAQSNEGDATPNTAGPKCLDTGLPCDAVTSTCNGMNELCVAFGPGDDMFESTKIIANLQLGKANELYDSAQNPIHGPIGFIHQHIDMENYTFLLNGEPVTTCSASLGFSFAAGTIDGPGAFDFHQATPQGTQNDLWNQVRNFLHTPTQEMLDCQYPKAVLLPTGEMHIPVAWTPKITPTQIFRIGNLVLLAVPGEFTTMSGRRLRESVQQVLEDNGFDTDGDLQVVIAGLSNTYTNYIATYEEYQLQRYEGASTMYGPNTLNAYINQYNFLAENFAQGTNVDPGPDPPNLLDEQFTLLPEVLFETTPPGTQFGDCVVDADSQYSQGSTVSVTFICGNPRNNIMRNSTFLTVEYEDPSSGEWQVVANDAFWETKFGWAMHNTFFQQSVCTIEWAIPEEAAVGNYRIHHQGYHKLLFGGIEPYEGYSSTFKVNVAQPFGHRPFYKW